MTFSRQYSQWGAADLAAAILAVGLAAAAVDVLAAAAPAEAGKRLPLMLFYLSKITPFYREYLHKHTLFISNSFAGKNENPRPYFCFFSMKSRNFSKSANYDTYPVLPDKMTY
jgi:hypothetical protein